MSRIGNRIIEIPNGVKVNLSGQSIAVEGPKGKMGLQIDNAISCELSDNTITLKRASDVRTHKALHGLYRSLVNNLVVGVSTGFTKNLSIQGVGYKAQMKGKTLVLDLGYSHQVEFAPPEGVEIRVDNPTSITVEGMDKQLVGQVAADIRDKRKPEPYKGKGIRYTGEEVRRKQGKKVG